MALTVVLPAYAGMIPEPSIGHAMLVCAPRIRGDDPVSTTLTIYAHVCSPHTRG